ncbi:MAG TPA: fibronectin type III domain-containing protein, partial [Actinoplanes sp.]|nr:fibronectin type III domain-containing protein [Actinoplanes sp.]
VSPQHFGPDTAVGYPDAAAARRQDPPWDERHLRQVGGGVAVVDGRAAYRRGRGPVVFAAIAAGLAAVIAVVALVVVLAGRGMDGAERDGTPKLGGNPPTDVRLRDSGSTVEVSWRDPTDATVPFVVMGARGSEQLTAMARLGPGQTRLKLDGLNARLDYCFVVVAVYADDEVATSPQACTSRDTSAPTAAPTS